MAEGIRGLPYIRVAHMQLMRGLLHIEVAYDARPVPMDSRAYCAMNKSMKKSSNF